MRKFQIALAVAIVAVSGMMIMCNNNPSTPVVTRNVFFTENFENADSIISNWGPLIYQTGFTAMSTSTDYAHSPTHSLTGTDSLTGSKRPISPSIMDSIAGLEFYLFAKQNEHIDFYGALATTGSSLNGLAIVMGIGISKTDSLMWVFQAGPDSSASIHKVGFAVLTLNTWNKCNIEYNFNTSTLTYSLNDVVVHTQNIPVPPPAVQWVVTDRENPGVQGPKQYYIDDMTVYQR
jgi:hypothetical protein